MRMLLVILTFAWPLLAEAACGPIAGAPGPRQRQVATLAAVPPLSVELTFLGHASFTIRSPAGVTIVTDYNGYNVPAEVPDIVTMNNAHSTHYTDFPDPRIRHVLRGWSAEPGRPVFHALPFKDVLVRNVPTNARMWGDDGATRVYGNSIFIYETAGLCLAHLGHIHHRLTEADLPEIGTIDILMAPVDGFYTMSQEDVLSIVMLLKPSIVVPMHYFGMRTRESFIRLIAPTHELVEHPGPTAVFSRADLPERPQLHVLQGY